MKTYTFHVDGERCGLVRARTLDDACRQFTENHAVGYDAMPFLIFGDEIMERYGLARTESVAFPFVV